jgi:fatty acid desaturase
VHQPGSHVSDKRGRTINTKNNNELDWGEIEGQQHELLQLRGILRKEIPQYSQLTPWKSYLALAWQWLVIGLLVAAAIQSRHWLVWFIAIFLIAGRQHALGVIGHEGAHYRLSRNKQLNEFVADVFCWLPLMFCHRRWQYEHILHHKYVNTEDDPYLKDFRTYSIWIWPKTPRQAWITLVRLVTGVEAKAILEPGLRWSIFGSTPVLTPGDKLRAIVFYSLLATVLTLSGGWLAFLLLWIVPMVTWSLVFVHWRTVAEHRGLDVTMDIGDTRHVDANWLERLTVAPLGINYHIDHHLFPSIPFYNLPKFHRRLLQEPIYREYARLKAGYFGRNGVYEEVVQSQS